MRRLIKIPSWFLLVVLLSGSHQPLFAGGTPESQATIIHVVLVWLKEPGNPEHRRQVIDASREFETIPGVVEVRVGESVPSDRTVVDDSFDIGLYLTFANTEDLEAYLSSARHQTALRDVMRPLTSRYIVYDFEDKVQ